jgi:hypothetical protein
MLWRIECLGFSMDGFMLTALSIIYHGKGKARTTECTENKIMRFARSANPCLLRGLRGPRLAYSVLNQSRTARTDDASFGPDRTANHRSTMDPSRANNPLFGPNKFKLGVFSANCDGGLTMSLAPERWARTGTTSSR